MSKNREQLDGGVGAGRRKRVREGEGDAAPAEWEKQEGEEFQVSFFVSFSLVSGALERGKRHVASEKQEGEGSSPSRRGRAGGWV